MSIEKLFYLRHFVRFAFDYCLDSGDTIVLDIILGPFVILALHSRTKRKKTCGTYIAYK